MPVDTSCINTTVRNVSGHALYFGFLGPRGKSLEDGEEYSVLGGFDALLNRNDQRTRDLFKAAIEAGVLDVIETPHPHFLDHTTHLVKQIDVDNGAVVVHDPCWGTFSSAAAV